MEIPKQLRDGRFRFIRVGKRDKKPIDNDWPTKSNFTYDDPSITSWLAEKGNLGLLTGVGELVVLDIDHRTGENLAHQLPKTFTVGTSFMPDKFRKKHFYFFCPQTRKIILNDRDEHLGELQCRGQQVLAPPSIHPSGVSYEVIEDVPIATVSIEQMRSVLSVFASAPVDDKMREPFRLPDKMVKGDRNDSLFRVACSMRSKNIDEAAILAALRVQNAETCDPPLEANEIKTILKSAMKYKPQDPILKERSAPPTEKEKKERAVANAILNGSLAEEIFDVGKQKAEFITLHKGQLITLSVLNLEDGPANPLLGEELEKGLVELADGAIPYGSVTVLIDEIQVFIHKYLEITPMFERLSAFFILMTWIYDKLHYVPYLRALGDTGTGKNRFLDVVGGLCFRQMKVNSAVTPAPVFRLLEKWRGTLILDEADFPTSDETSEIVKILNSGMQSNTPVMRMEKVLDSQEIKTFRVFGPKILASRKTFKDKALEARCLTEVMQEMMRLDIPDQLGGPFFDELKLLRRKLMYFRLENWLKIDPMAMQNVDLHFLEPRLRQIGRSILSVAVDVDSQKAVTDFLRKYNQELIEERASTTEGEIVQVLSDLINEGEKEITSGAIAVKIDPDKKWLRPQKVGAVLKVLGLKTKISGPNVGRKRIVEYDIDTIERLKRRYIPSFGVQGVQGVQGVRDELNEKTSVKTDISGKSVQVSLDTVGVVHHVHSYTQKNNSVMDIATKLRQKYPTILTQTSDEEIIEWAVKNGYIHEPTPGKFEFI